MSTVADWDADVAAEVVSAITAWQDTPWPAGTGTPTRSESDLRRGRMDRNNYRFQIRHAQQGEDSALVSGASRDVVATEMEIHHRLGYIDAGGPVLFESERQYMTDIMLRIQSQLTPASTWRAKDSVHRVIGQPVVPVPETPSPGVIGFSLSLSVELAP